MSDNLKRLQYLADYPDTIDIDAIDWAIDQLRWRRVDDELPEDGDTVLALDCVGDIRRAEYMGRNHSFYDLYDEEFKIVEWWRPITMPEAS